MNIVAMVPVRLGSKRVKNKNIRYLGDKPLVEHILYSLKQVSELKDNIYINANEDIFDEIAKRNKVCFYKRPIELSYDDATNDAFMYDFLQNIKCDWLVQAHSTSPFVTVKDIKTLLSLIRERNNNYDSIFSVKEEQIESLYKDHPINFTLNDQMKKSQDLVPVQSFCNGLMAFKRESFLRHYKELGYALFAGRPSYFTLKGYATLDIDTEEDFSLAEGIYESKRNSSIPIYYQGNEDSYPERILGKEGIGSFFENTLMINNLNTIINKHTNDSWAERIINTSSNCATLICQKRNEGNRLHYHPNFDEWWYIIEGRIEILKYSKNEDPHRYILNDGDIILFKRGTRHQVHILSERAIRLSVNREDIPHVYSSKII